MRRFTQWVLSHKLIVAVAWLIARPSVTAPTASATNLEQLDELLKSAELKLDAAAIQQIDAASRPR